MRTLHEKNFGMDLGQTQNPQILSKPGVLGGLRLNFHQTVFTKSRAGSCSRANTDILHLSQTLTTN
jgi:hypothetical protein